MEAQGLTAEEGLVSENRPVMADALELAESPAPTAMCTRVSAEEDRDAELPAASTPSSASRDNRIGPVDPRTWLPWCPTLQGCYQVLKRCELGYSLLCYQLLNPL